MKQRIKTKLTTFHVARLRDAFEHLGFNNLDTKDDEYIGNLDVMWINGNVYVSVTDMNGNIVMTCIEEAKETEDE